MSKDIVQVGPLQRGRITTTLFAPLNILDGTVIGRMQRHRYQEVVRFLTTIEAQVPVGK
jgi:hypothetical protein